MNRCRQTIPFHEKPEAIGTGSVHGVNPATVEVWDEERGIIFPDPGPEAVGSQAEAGDDV